MQFLRPEVNIQLHPKLMPQTWKYWIWATESTHSLLQWQILNPLSVGRDKTHMLTETTSHPQPNEPQWELPDRIYIFLIIRDCAKLLGEVSRGHVLERKSPSGSKDSHELRRRVMKLRPALSVGNPDTWIHVNRYHAYHTPHVYME